MKVAYVSEWRPDEAVARILVEAILGEPTEPIAPPIRTRGWPSVRNLLPAVLKHVYYGTDADALVVLVDSNRSPVYTDKDREGLETKEECRLVQLQKALAETQAQLPQLPTRARIKTAVGLAVLAIEAWLLCGVDRNVSEGAWVRALREGRVPYTKNELKVRVYGSDRAGEVLKTERSIAEARRLAQDIALLESKFPIGFGALAGDVRAW